jgi:hypothetical protein
MDDKPQMLDDGWQTADYFQLLWLQERSIIKELYEY